jgi:hypothetical protein
MPTMTKTFDPWMNMHDETTTIPKGADPEAFVVEAIKEDEAYMSAAVPNIKAITVTRERYTWSLTITFTDGRSPQTDTYTYETYDCEDITRIECLSCGHSTTDKSVMDCQWNVDGRCPECKGLRSAWEHDDGSVQHLTARPDGGEPRLVTVKPSRAEAQWIQAVKGSAA